MRKIKIGFLLDNLAGGGAERMMLNLAVGFSKEYDVVIYLVNKKGIYLKKVPDNIPIIDLHAKYGVKSVIHKLRRIYIKDSLDVLISTQDYINAVAVMASLGLKQRPKIILREASTPSQRNVIKWRRIVYSWLYKRADHLAAVSKGVKKDMIQVYNVNEPLISVVYNPVVNDELFENAQENVSHPWFMNSNNIPLIISMGRFHPLKRFEDVIDAFYLVREKQEAKLVIFGDYSKNMDYYNVLKNRVKQYNLEDYVYFPGFVENPFKYLSRASVFVLTSEYEGLPGVLIQALACGCQVVSTDCPSGPNEILENGKYGELIEIKDTNSLSKKIELVLKQPRSKEENISRGKKYSVDNSVSIYKEIIKKVL